MRELVSIVRDKNPLEHPFEFALWTVAIVRPVIRRQFDVHLTEVSVARILP